MKTQHIFALFFILGAVGCQTQIEESQLVGNWQVVNFSANLPGLSSALIESGKTEALSSEYSFAEDGVSRLRSDYYQQGQAGTWSFDSSSNEISIVHAHESNAGPESYVVKSLNGSTMVWYQQMGDLGSMTMTLNRR